MIEDLLQALIKTPFIDTLAMKLVRNMSEQIMIIEINKKFLKKQIKKCLKIFFITISQLQNILAKL